MDTSSIVKNLATDLSYRLVIDCQQPVVTIPDNAVMARVLIYTSSAAFGSVSIDHAAHRGEVPVKTTYDVVTTDT